MRKAYSKPEIFFEDFSLTTNIAANCEFIINTSSENVCGFEIQDEFLGTQVLFTNGVTNCKTVPQDGMYNGFCYHNPGETNNMFTS